MKPRVFMSELTGRVYVTSRYDELPGGQIVVTGVKHDVTDAVRRHLMAKAWLQGWNDCDKAKPGTSVPNPYRIRTRKENQ